MRSRVTPEALGHLFQRARMFALEPEAELDDLALAVGQHGQGVVDPVAIELRGHGVERPDGVLVLDEVAQLGVLFVTDGRLQRDRGLADAQDLADLGVGHAHLGGDLLGRAPGPCSAATAAARGSAC